MSCSLKPKEVELDVFSGQLTYMPSPNFSYDEIPTGCCMRIHQYQQMLLYDDIIIDGDLIIDGTLVFVE